MRVYEVDKKEFYKGYTLKELFFLKKRLKLIEKELDAGNLEHALVLVMDHPYIDYPEFNFYRINILIRLGKLDLALDVASDPKFKDFNPIQMQREGLTEAIRLKEEQEKEEERKRQEEKRIREEKIRQEEENKKKYTVDNIKPKRVLMTRLYVGLLTLEEIDNADLSDFDKILFKICYYDKYSHASGVRYIKTIKDKITDDRERKIINNFRSKLESKRSNFFDIAAYNKYLAGVDFEYAAELKKQIEEEKSKTVVEEIKQPEKVVEEQVVVPYEEPVVVEPEKVMKPDFVPKQPQQIKGTIGPKVVEQEPIKVVKVKKNKNAKKQKADNVDSTIVRIRDAFPIEVQAIGAYIYVEANRQKTAGSVKALDIFEGIINQEVTNINALMKFENLVIKFSRDERIGVTYSEERFGRYLKKE